MGRVLRLEIVNRLLKDFEETNKSGRYKSDLELFIRESKLEDFWNKMGKLFLCQRCIKRKDGNLIMFFYIWRGSLFLLMKKKIALRGND